MSFLKLELIIMQFVQNDIDFIPPASVPFYIEYVMEEWMVYWTPSTPLFTVAHTWVDGVTDPDICC